MVVVYGCAICDAGCDGSMPVAPALYVCSENCKSEWSRKESELDRLLLTEKEVVGQGEGNFFLSPSIAQLAASQGITPLKDAKTLGGMLADDEVEDFISTIYASREKH